MKPKLINVWIATHSEFSFLPLHEPHGANLTSDTPFDMHFVFRQDINGAAGADWRRHFINFFRVCRSWPFPV